MFQNVNFSVVELMVHCNRYPQKNLEEFPENRITVFEKSIMETFKIIQRGRVTSILDFLIYILATIRFVLFIRNSRLN